MSKQAALEKIDAMQTTKKPRRTAQDVARDVLVKERDRIALAWSRAREKVNDRFAAKFADAERALQAFEKALNSREDPADDE